MSSDMLDSVCVAADCGGSAFVDAGKSEGEKSKGESSSSDALLEWLILEMIRVRGEAWARRMRPEHFASRYTYLSPHWILCCITSFCWGAYPLGHWSSCVAPLFLLLKLFGA